MVNAPEKNISQLLAGKYCESTKQSTQRRHQVNKGKSGLEADRVQGWGALRSIRSKMKLSADKRPQTHIFINKEIGKWIDYYVDRETAGASKRVEDAKTAIMPEQEDISDAEKERLTTQKPEQIYD